VSSFTLNPEFLRYARSQLRPAKLLSAAIISLVLSITLAFVVLHGKEDSPDTYIWSAKSLLATAFILQALVLAIGGGIACFNSIYSEKEQNTFDYQRITRLSPLELALGKLFGAPLLMYFICLCATPLTLYAANAAHARPSLILAAYVVLLIGSLAFHSFTLLLSLLAVKGSQATGIILALLLLWMGSMDPSNGYLKIHPLGPFDAENFATASSWDFTPRFRTVHGMNYPAQEFADIFFGHTVHHFPVLVVIDLFLACWFLLAVVRNIKRDPPQYEIYSPLQFLAFALFLNFLFLGFSNSTQVTPLDAQGVFLTFDIVVFFFLGVALLRNRERMRNLLLAHGRPAPNLWISSWPAPVLALGTLLAGGMIVAGMNYSHSSAGDWSLGFAILRSLFFTLWLVSNLQFLQCMNLRPGKHPLVMSVLYLSIYYVCACFFLKAFGCFRIPEFMPISSLFVPSAVFLLDSKAWQQGPTWWATGFAVQLVLTTFFFFLQSRRLRHLLPLPDPEPDRASLRT
jgi:hypothetical protein